MTESRPAKKKTPQRNKSGQSSLLAGSVRRVELGFGYKLVTRKIEPLRKPCSLKAVRQFGFRAGLLTVDGVMQVVDVVRRAEARSRRGRRVVLDFRNAINSVRWKDILAALDNTFHGANCLLRILSD